ncbi:cell division ATP-binding protein FtsE [Ruminococcus champanellensis]|uniref:ABC-type antimicrobial peptide transport system, ATPase component n=1 Tax=Ruminococcus champanellensis (strain DSM 18848 / JCM 17042 / KCTC 15320 / 18P13) TaxID=213810 RepID=D4LDN0_RUMC1|nr:ATP-binding cassette domain-containing protein [Ruminococcus champanellensis]MED9890779.1 ATP-binding cassette domain-containing protein [Ruminococcus champanellensis]CBL17725.1 ABC-type antimicrobial peptide transport system, ATPase component [Ruminococcus champanellensis 18P13 = JCM 17042]
MIQINHVKKAIGGHVIFDDLSMQIADREFAVLTGPSGCGKTTLLHMIGGIEPVDSGDILVGDFNVANGKNLMHYYRHEVGFLFQNFALVERKTVAENLGMIRKDARSSLSMVDALRRVGMEGKETQMVYSLSGGEQQRIALARLMMKQCSLILADEPTGSLDPNNAAQVMEILKSFSEMGKTVIMVTHAPNLIEPSMRHIALDA